jgi:RimJ/RimL family protein N-acetyltransferase
MPPQGSESPNSLSEIIIRTYRLDDHAQVMRPHHEGLFTGILVPLDSAMDLDRIEEVYLRKAQDHFWVTEARGLIIASIGLAESDPQVAHLRRLRVDPAWRKGLTGEVARLLL